MLRSEIQVCHLECKAANKYLNFSVYRVKSNSMVLGVSFFLLSVVCDSLEIINTLYLKQIQVTVFSVCITTQS